MQAHRTLIGVLGRRLNDPQRSGLFVQESADGRVARLGVIPAGRRADPPQVQMIEEHGYRVAIVSPLVLNLSRPLFRSSPPHRGRVMRIAGRRRGPVLRDWRGLY